MSTDLDLEEFETEDALAGYDYPKAGQYHLIVSDVDDSHEKITAMKVDFEVLNGTTPGQAGKTFTENFWEPKPDGKDGGKFARKRLGKLALASGLIDKSALGTRVQINWDDLKGRQLIGHVTEYSRKGDDGKEYKGAQIDGLHLYAVDDPSQQHVPCDGEALKMAGKSRAPAANGAGQQPAAQKPAPAKGKKVALNDL